MYSQIQMLSFEITYLPPGQELSHNETLVDPMKPLLSCGLMLHQNLPINISG